MDETLACPDCQAQLVLPSLPAGQTVQCPRCRHVFEPFRQRGRAPVAAPLPPVIADDDPFETPFTVDRPLPLRGGYFGKLAMWLIGVCCLLSAIQLVQHIEAAWLIQNLIDGAGPVFDWENRLFDVEERTRPLGALLLLAALLAGFVYLRWVYLASSNLLALKAKGIRNTPGGTVWAHFMPVANLVLPYLALQEIWRASDPDSLNGPRSWQNTPASPLIRACWACGCLAWLLAALGSHWYSANDPFGPFGGFRDLKAQRVGVCFYAFAFLAASITGVLCIYLIRGITQRQRDRHDEVYRD